MTKNQPTDLNAGRLPGLDVARMLAMYLVVVLHMVTSFVEPSGGISERILRAVSICCVDLFGLISGYVGIASRRIKVSRILKLWLQVVFTGVCVTAAWYFLPYDVRPSLKDWGKALLPISSHEYWYFTAYFLLFLCMPILNTGIRSMSRNALVGVCLGLVVMVVIIPALNPYGGDTYILESGYSPMWLILLYLFGAGLRLLLPLIRLWSCLGLYAVGIGVTACSSGGGGYTSPSVLLTAVAMLLACAHISSIGAAFRFFSTSAFGVYLWHAHPLVFAQLRNSFCVRGELAYCVTVIFGAAGIYVTCTILEFLRMRLFVVVDGAVDRICERVVKS